MSKPIVDNEPLSKDIAATLEEFSRQIATQAALLAGLGFTGLSAVSYESSTPRWLILAFGISTALSTPLELLTLFLVGILSVMCKRRPLNVWFDIEVIISIITYIPGLFFFMVSLVHIAWIKLRPVAPFVTGIAFLKVIAGIWLYLRIGRIEISFWQNELMAAKALR